MFFVLFVCNKNTSQQKNGLTIIRFYHIWAESNRAVTRALHSLTDHKQEHICNNPKLVFGCKARTTSLVAFKITIYLSQINIFLAIFIVFKKSFRKTLKFSLIFPHSPFWGTVYLLIPRVVTTSYSSLIAIDNKINMTALFSA